MTTKLITTKNLAAYAAKLLPTVDLDGEIAAAHDTDTEREGFTPARLSAASIAASLLGKADLVSGAVPDAQLPTRLSDARLKAAYGAPLSRLNGSSVIRSWADNPAHAPALMGTAPIVTQDTTARTGLTTLLDKTQLRWTGPLLNPPFTGGTMQPAGAHTSTGGAFSGKYGELLFEFDGRYLDIDMILKATTKWRMLVDGKASSAAPTLVPAGTGARGILHFDFGAASRPNPRRIALELEDSAGGIAVYNLKIAPTDYLAPLSIPSPRVMIVGDSFAVAESGATSRLNSYARALGRLMGWAEVWSHSTSYSGTGLVHANDPNVGNYGARMQYDVTPYSPDLVIIQGSVNDTDSAGLVGPALTSYVTTLKAAVPNVSVVVTGPLTMASPTAVVTTINTEMKAAAAALGVPFVDPYDPVVFTGDTVAGDTTPNGSGNADFFRNGSDKTHPTDAGAYALARRLAGPLGKALGLPVA